MRPLFHPKAGLLPALCMAILLSVGLPAGQAAASDPKPGHRLIIHVNENDPARMNLALNNLTNVYEYYRKKNEPVQVELVAYGPGLHIFRDDTSPVKQRIESLKLAYDNITFSACGNTMKGMEKAEAKPVRLIDDVGTVASGVIRIMELQEEGWSYLRP